MPDPEVPDTMDLLQDKMMTALRNIIMTSIEKAFSTVFFGRIIMNWSVSPCTSDKIKELMTNVVEKEAEAEAEHVNNNGGMTLIGKKVKTWEPLLGNDNEGLRGVKFKIVDT